MVSNSDSIGHLMTEEESRQERLKVLARKPNIVSPHSGETFKPGTVLADTRVIDSVVASLGTANGYVERYKDGWVLSRQGEDLVGRVVERLPGRGQVPDDQFLKGVSISLQEDAWTSPRTQGALTDQEATFNAYMLASRLSGRPDVRFPDEVPFSVFDLAEPQSVTSGQTVQATHERTESNPTDVSPPLTGYVWKQVA
jgi:hypothetical protein